MLGRIDALLPLRAWWVIPIAIIPQIIGLGLIRTNEDLRGLKIALFIGSYVLALAPAWANRERWGARFMGLGIGLNLLAMVANGGLMPVAPEARIATGKQVSAPVNELGRMVPKSKDVLLTPEQTNLYPLTDVIIVGWPVYKAISIGDIVLLSGMLVLIAELSWGARPARRTEDAVRI